MDSHTIQKIIKKTQPSWTNFFVIKRVTSNTTESWECSPELTQLERLNNPEIKAVWHVTTLFQKTEPSDEV